MKHGRFGALLAALSAIAAMNVGAIAGPVARSARAARSAKVSASSLDYASPSRTIGSGYGRWTVAQDRRRAKKARNVKRHRAALKNKGRRH